MASRRKPERPPAPAPEPRREGRGSAVPPRPSPTSVTLLALEDIAGAAIVLDRELRVLDFTPLAEQLMAAPLARGVFAAKALCGEGDQRPVAEALAAGQPVAAEVPRVHPEGGTRVLYVRGTPIRRAGVIEGFVLLLEESGWEQEAPDAPVERFSLLTADRAMKRLLRDIERVARRSATVLVRGETGTGKELVARGIHAASDRRDGPFRAINCAALPPHLLESELFGHVRGAFTGAVRDAPGHFRLATGGTLFLDEVAELSLELQAKLLRVLQERVVVPVGGRDSIPIDVRVVSATHRSLQASVAEGSFRADLMYRLRVVPLFIPPLRERGDDVLHIARRFIEEQNAQGERQVLSLSSGARARLLAHPFPGNVRELQNVIEYAFTMGDGPVLMESDLPPELREAQAADAQHDGAPHDDGRAHVNVPRPPRDPGGSPAPSDGRAAYGAAAQRDEAARIRYALERASGHRGRAAQSLGVSRATLWRRMRALGLHE
ncbi:MAG: sigma 54-interacting transcriptional regulator [Polyangiales bacterium]|nr:sigma 54-interacting transcriptional regulator [Myxococcales bacterium]MCB9657289.1 sigma 54-interacting transcriptional regulator [Sandaracinaceae bacterium]